LRRDPATAGIFLDFDGTLAPIVDDPDQARPVPRATAVLAVLAQRYGRVAVISGRPVSYLADHLAYEEAGEDTSTSGPELIGLYGMQRCRWDAGSLRVHESPEALPWREALSEAAAVAESSAPPGVMVERKGLALTLHYRRAPDAAQWVNELASTLSARSGLVAHLGKMSVELRPPVLTDKGSVVEELGSGLRAVLLAGDDVGDIPAFEALARLHAAGISTLGVVVTGPEVPRGLTEVADVTVDGPQGLLVLLDELAAP
jgi:trehalose 6-phosphate phosphatase